MVGFVGFLGGKGKQGAIDTGVYVGGRFLAGGDGVKKCSVFLNQTGMFFGAVPTVADAVEDWFFCLSITLEAKNFRFGQSGLDHTVCANDAHFQVFARQMWSEETQHQCTADSVGVFETDGRVADDLVRCVENTVDTGCADGADSAGSRVNPFVHQVEVMAVLFDQSTS